MKKLLPEDFPIVSLFRDKWLGFPLSPSGRVNSQMKKKKGYKIYFEFGKFRFWL
jgi:hypothetical protein